MKGKLPVILAVMLALALPIVAAAGGEQAPEREVDEAWRIGEAWVDRIAVTDAVFSEWQGAHLTSPQPYYNPKGEVIAYMFAIEKNGKAVGRVLVGSAAYGFPIFEAGKTPPFPIPPVDEVSSILRREHGLQIPQEMIGEPRLLLLNILWGFYAIWEVEGQVVGINLIRGYSIVVPGMEVLKFAMPTPLEYKAAKRASIQSLAETPYEIYATSGDNFTHIRDHQKMTALTAREASILYHKHGYKAWCGPASGMSIGSWKREADGDVNLHDCRVDMFIALQYHMRTLWPPVGWTFPWSYGRGFVRYGTARGEYFRWRYRHTFSHVMSDIHLSRPIGLCGWMKINGEKKAHWVAIRGFRWDPPVQKIEVTDSFTHDDARRLCWHALQGGLFLFLIRIYDFDN